MALGANKNWTEIKEWFFQGKIVNITSYLMINNDLNNERLSQANESEKTEMLLRSNTPLYINLFPGRPIRFKTFQIILQCITVSLLTAHYVI